MSSFTRRGRPPTVIPGGPVNGNGEPTEFNTTVKGQQFSFRKGDDGRLRQVGRRATGEAEDASYARTVVERYISSGPDTEAID